MSATAVVSAPKRRGGVPRAALIVSLVAHVALVIWAYQWAPVSMRKAAFERIIPVFVAPRPVIAPPPRQTPPLEAQESARDPGGRTGAGKNAPAVPVRQPERIFDPERVIEIPATRNPDPRAPTLIPNAGSGQVQGEEATGRTGTGEGEGDGVGRGTGPGRNPGGVANAPTGWTPQWRQRPSREQVDALYPKAAFRAGVSGGATLICTLGVTGRVRDCSVLREAPPGQGFGQAVLSLSRYFRITPRKVNGRAVETRLVIPYILIIDPPATDLRPIKPIGSAPSRGRDDDDEPRN